MSSSTVLAFADDVHFEFEKIVTLFSLIMLSTTPSAPSRAGADGDGLDSQKSAEASGASSSAILTAAVDLIFKPQRTALLARGAAR